MSRLFAFRLQLAVRQRAIYQRHRGEHVMRVRKESRRLIAQRSSGRRLFGSHTCETHLTSAVSETHAQINFQG